MAQRPNRLSFTGLNAALVLRDPWMALGLVLLLVLVSASLLAPVITAHDPGFISPRARLRMWDTDFLMGTDALGRDLFSRILYGGRLSMLLAALVTVISVAIGLMVGLAAGYFRWVDAVVMRVVDGILAIPGLLLAIAMVSFGGATIPMMVIAISIPEIPRVVRLVRSVVLSVREEPYVESALGMGTPIWLILIRHIIPSTINPLLVQATFIAASAILIEAILGFLGLGFPPEVPSLGGIIAEGRPFFQRAPWIILFPATYLAVLILSVNIVSDALRDRLDPRLLRKASRG